MSPTAPARRRTQAERRAATRAALLDATIDCLIEYGYAGVTTTLIAERAGVTRGAQAHHFPTKAELVTEAVRHLAQRLADEFVAGAASRSRRPARVIEDVMDRLWEVYSSPVYGAVLELWLAARTDEELRRHVAQLETDVVKALRATGVRLVPGFADRPEAARLLGTTLATIRGVAMLGFVHGPDHVGKQWRTSRRHLLYLWTTELGG